MIEKCLFATDIPKAEALLKCPCSKCVQTREFHNIKTPRKKSNVKISSRHKGALDFYKDNYGSEPNPKRYTLYRFWNSESELLYVGMTREFYIRMKAHSNTKDWWSEVSYITLTHLNSLAELRNAELEAIFNEKPKYNKADLQGVVVSS